MKVLVAYETVHGSTRSIAENIGRALGASTVVETCPMRDVDDLSAFDAFVFGSAEIEGAWLPRACDFLSEHAAELEGRPVWLFSVGVSDALPRPLRNASRRRELQEVRNCAPAVVHPQGIRVFSGLVQRDRVGRSAWLLPRTWVAPHNGDYREWPQIMTWARDIAATLTHRPAA